MLILELLKRYEQRISLIAASRQDASPVLARLLSFMPWFLYFDAEDHTCFAQFWRAVGSYPTFSLFLSNCCSVLTYEAISSLYLVIYYLYNPPIDLYNSMHSVLIKREYPNVNASPIYC